MLIRISLIAAIVLSLAVVGLSVTQIKDKINTTLADRDQFHSERDTARNEASKAQKEKKEALAKLDDTTKELNSTKDERDQAVATAADAVKKEQAATAKLTDTQAKLDTAQNDLAAWTALGIPVDQIVATLKSIKDITADRDAIAAENEIITRANRKMKIELLSYKDPNSPPELPAGLHGKVLVADPKYNFVVLDIGEKQSLVENGQLLVERNGKLVAKIKVQSVQDNRSIANVMPGWKLSDVMEGDQVFY